MDAPTYRPATAYVRPVPAPFVFGVDTISVREAVSAPAVKRIMVEEAPQMTPILNASQVQAHISNWSIRSLHTINLISADALARIEKRLLALPVAERPKL